MTIGEMFWTGIAFGAIGFVSVLTIFAVQEWTVRRGSRRWRRDMEGR
jgi:hypothetical protein